MAQLVSSIANMCFEQYTLHKRKYYLQDIVRDSVCYLSKYSLMLSYDFPSK